MNIFCGILYILSFINLTKIYTSNQAKKKAEKNYAAHSYKESVSYLHMLVDSLQIKDDNALIDLGHSYYQIHDNKKAENYYNKSINSSNSKIKSIASHQLGILASKEKENEKALAYFKSALQADPTNEKARYNYELLKRESEKEQSDKNQKKDEQDKNKDQENKDNSKKQDQNNKEQKQSSKKDQEKNKKEDQNQSKEKDKKQEEQSAKNNKQEDKKDKQSSAENKSEKEKNEKEKKESIAKQLQQLKLTEEKATSILDAMKNNETQYLQQKKKKPMQSTPDNKPTW